MQTPTGWRCPSLEHWSQSSQLHFDNRRGGTQSSLFESPEQLVSVAPYGQKGQPRFKAEDGHLVRSKSEMLIDNRFYNKGIVHAYESRVPIKTELYSSNQLGGYWYDLGRHRKQGIKITIKWLGAHSRFLTQFAQSRYETVSGTCEQGCYSPFVIYASLTMQTSTSIHLLKFAN